VSGVPRRARKMILEVGFLLLVKIKKIGVKMRKAVQYLRRRNSDGETKPREYLMMGTEMPQRKALSKSNR